MNSDLNKLLKFLEKNNFSKHLKYLNYIYKKSNYDLEEESFSSIIIDGKKDYLEEPNSWNSYIYEQYEMINRMLSSNSKIDYENFFGSLHSKAMIYHLSNIDMGDEFEMHWPSWWEEEFIFFEKSISENYLVISSEIFYKLFPLSSSKTYSLMVSAANGLELSEFKDHINIFCIANQNGELAHQEVVGVVIDSCFKYLGHKLPELNNMAKKYMKQHYSSFSSYTAAYGDYNFIIDAARFLSANSISVDNIGVDDFISYINNQDLNKYFVIYANSSGMTKNPLISDINWTKNKDLIIQIEEIILPIVKLTRLKQ